MCHQVGLQLVHSDMLKSHWFDKLDKWWWAERMNAGFIIQVAHDELCDVWNIQRTDQKALPSPP